MTIAIIGAGLSGLYGAWRLHKAGKQVQVFEARDRIGGRVLTVPSAENHGAFDLGPTWFWPDHQHRMSALLGELGIKSFEQQTQGGMMFEPADGPPQMMAPPAMGPSSYRVEGGIGSLLNALHGQLPENTINLNTPIHQISQSDDGLKLTSDTDSMTASHVLVSVPPRLFASSITTEPALPDTILTSFNKTPTWMAAHAKLVIVYDQPFWRDNGLSGQGFSYRGPMMEIHDASPDDDGPFALFGFVGIDAPRRRNNADTIRQLGVDQLVRLFGPNAASPLDILYKDWSEDTFTATSADEDTPSSHTIYQSPELPDTWSDRLHFIGTEAAPQHGGYLEGCLEAVEATCLQF